MRKARLLHIVVWAAGLGFGQTPAFEVASVRPAVPGTLGGKVDFLPGGVFRAQNVPLTFVIQQVVGLRNFQIVGAPAEMAVIADGYTARYDIEAKGSPEATKVQVHEMAKALLAERFHLEAHKDTRDLPVYALITAKGGVRVITKQNVVLGRGGGLGVEFVAKGWIRGTNVVAAGFAMALSQLMDRPVLDRSNLADPFDFSLTWTPEDVSPSPEGSCPAEFLSIQQRRGLKAGPMTCPSIFTAIQDQLGLKLDARKEPIEVLVIDHVERPSSN